MRGSTRIFEPRTEVSGEVKEGQEAVEARLEVVRDVVLGSPLFLTARRFVRICHWIEKGESFSEPAAWN